MDRCRINLVIPVPQIPSKALTLPSRFTLPDPGGKLEIDYFIVGLWHQNKFVST